MELNAILHAVVGGRLVEWIGAMSTVGALIAGFWAAATAFKALEREAQRDEWRDAREERAQAAKVAAWIDPTANHPDLAQDGASSLVIAVRNGSEVPIYNLWIDATFRQSNTSLPRSALAVLAPESTHLYALVLSADSGPAATIASDIGIDLVFRDAAGVTWRRDSHGTLQRLSPKAPATT